MFEFYNVHPDGKFVNDCVKRAITVTENRDYNEVKIELNRLKRELGAKKFNENIVWRTYIERKGYKKLSFPAVKGQSRMNGERFAEEHPKGSYILNMAGHLSACVDGVIYDTWNCGHKCVYTAFKVA